MLVAVSFGSGVLFAAAYQIVPWARVFNGGSAVAADEVGSACGGAGRLFPGWVMPAGAFQQGP